MANLRHLLKEYLELNDRDIESVISQFQGEWQALFAQTLPDDQAAEVIEKLLGIPDWTKTKPA